MSNPGNQHVNTCGGCGSPIAPQDAACQTCGTLQTTVPVVHSTLLPTAPPTHQPPMHQQPPSRPQDHTSAGPQFGGPAPSYTSTPSYTASPSYSGTIPTTPTRAPTGKYLAIGGGAALLVLGVVIGVIALTSKSHTTHAESNKSVAVAQIPTTDRVTSAPTSTTIAPTTTIAPAPGVPVLAPGVTDPQNVVPIIQQYATALAHKNFDLARTIQPSLGSSDADLAAGYANLNESTVIATSVSPDGTNVNGAYLAWETATSGAQQTSIYCVSWTLDPTQHQLISANSGATANAQWPLWEPPPQALSTVQQVCG